MFSRLLLVALLSCFVCCGAHAHETGGTLPTIDPIPNLDPVPTSEPELDPKIYQEIIDFWDLWQTPPNVDDDYCKDLAKQIEETKKALKQLEAADAAHRLIMLKLAKEEHAAFNIYMLLQDAASKKDWQDSKKRFDDALAAWITVSIKLEQTQLKLMLLEMHYDLSDCGGG